MKTINNNPLNSTVSLIILTVILVFAHYAVNAQSKNKIDYLSLKKLPAGLSIQENGPYSYEMIADYYNNDILGNFRNKTQVKGIYTRGLDSGYVRWNDVTISQASGLNDPFPKGTSQDYMENFTYIPSVKMMGSEPYKNFPALNGVFTKNLVWDVMGFEAFAWTYYDSLQLNIPFIAKSINGKVDLKDLGTFDNKNIVLSWTGISIMNNKPCATIEFLAMDNPIDFKTDYFDMKGRSTYWGTIWLSLDDKQIERGVLYEDVNMDMKMAGQDKSQLSNTTRKIEFNKILK